MIVPLTSTKHSEGPYSTRVLPCDGLANPVPIPLARGVLWLEVIKGTVQQTQKATSEVWISFPVLRRAPALLVQFLNALAQPG